MPYHFLLDYYMYERTALLSLGVFFTHIEWSFFDSKEIVTGFVNVQGHLIMVCDANWKFLMYIHVCEISTKDNKRVKVQANRLLSWGSRFETLFF